MSKVIIGIHGLGNKPARTLLETWWKKAILEGLRSINRTRLFIEFELVYWADVLNTDPLDPQIEDPRDPLFLEEPYTPERANKPEKTHNLQRKFLDYTEKQLDRLLLNDDMTINFSSITDRVIHHFFSNLEAYYSKSIQVPEKGEVPVKDIIREKLTGVLGRYKGDDILLIAHSMGSIIAYDVLIQKVSDIDVDTLITIGSPLGIPVIISRIFSEQSEEKQNFSTVKTPNCINKNWLNFSDPDDKVALDHTLGDDYGPNACNILAADKLIFNDYEFNGRRNPHKSFGYLRAPEIAEAIDRFLGGKTPWPLKALRYWFNGWLFDRCGRRRN